MEAGTKPYVVRTGDYLTAIAAAHGMEPGDIWEHESNAKLRKLRPNPEILKAGDVVYVPVVERTWLPVHVGQINKFVGSPVNVDVHLVLIEGATPLANTAFTVEGAGPTFPGSSDRKGRVTLSIPVTVRSLRLTLTDSQTVLDICVGGLDPIEETSGVQMRLAHLGFYSGAIDGLSERSLEGAIMAFQQSQNLEPTGTIDRPTSAKLRDVHGC